MHHHLGVSHAENELPDRNGHTERDAGHLVANLGVDGPMSTQPREHSRTCNHLGCRNKDVWHQAGGCDAHYIIPVAARRGAEVAA